MIHQLSLKYRQVYDCEHFALYNINGTKYLACVPFNLDSPYCELYANTAIRHAMQEAYEDFGRILNELEGEE